MIDVRCSSCGSAVAAGESAPGDTVGCPNCGQTLTVPAPTSNAETIAAPRNDPSRTLTAGSSPSSGPDGLIQIPGYEVLEEIGRGGMGVVYKAKQTNPPRLVAIKMVLAGEHADPDQLARFRTEAESTARLNHPAIVQIHHVGEWRSDTGDLLPFLTLEYVAGDPLSKMIKRGKEIRPRQSADLIRRLARGVHYAHQQGIVHRDLKPSNVLLSGSPNADSLGEPKIVDFGIAKPLEGFGATASDGPRTHSGAVLGTPSYMAPEQRRGAKNVGPAADTYSLGAILYELLTGRPPFLGESTVETLLRVTREDPEAPRRIRSSIPRDLETICLTCLAKDPGRRYASAGALADDLGRYLDGETVLVRAPSSMERLSRWSRKRKGLLYVGIGAAVTAAIVVGIILGQPGREPESSGTPDPTQPVAPNIDEARTRVEEVRNRMVTQNNMKQIAVAFHNYASANNDQFPLAAWSTKLDAQKQPLPLLSWRVAMLPYLEQDVLYRQFKLDEPWDSEHNKQLIGKMPRVYAPVGIDAEPNMTYLKVFVGGGAIFGRAANRYSIANITDGTSNTILLAEGGDPVVWTKPDDFAFDPNKPLPKLAFAGKSGFNVGLADGSVRYIDAKVSERTLKFAIQADDGQVLGSDWYEPAPAGSRQTFQSVEPRHLQVIAASDHWPRSTDGRREVSTVRRRASDRRAGCAFSQCPTCGKALKRQHAETVTFTPAAEDSSPSPTVTASPATGGPTSTVPAASSVPVRLPTIPGYDVLEVLGRGGMGVVYKARQLNPRRVVALKMLLAGRTDRFQAEVAAVARLKHPNIIQIHEVGDSGGRPYFSMEYVQGGTLADHLKKRPLSPVDAAELVARLARAVQHAHDLGVVHRDLKPGNVLMSPDDDEELSPRIADFGLAKHLEGSADGVQTQSGAVLGTPSYMAPEQALGKTREIGPAVDIYALGAILYECLTGQPPFREESQVDTLMKVVTAEPEPPSRIRPKLPRDVEIICLKCLRKEPAKRYASAKDLAADLERFAKGIPITARARSGRERIGGWLHRRRELVFLGGGAVLATALVLGFFTLWPQTNPKSPPAGDSLASLPPDLRYVSPDSFGFMTVRAAELFAHPSFRELVDHTRTLGSELSTEQMGSEVERATSIPLANMERVTFVMPTHRSDTLLIIYTTQPFSHENLGKMLAEGKQHTSQILDGRTLYLPSQDWRMAYCPASDRVLLMGQPELVRAAAMAKPTTGPLTPLLERAAGAHTFFLGGRPSPEDMAGMLVGLRLGREADPVAHLVTAGLAADLGQSSKPEGRVNLDLNAWAAYPTGEQAEAAEPQFPIVIKALTRLIGEEKSGPLPGALLKPYLGAIESARWERTGSTLASRARVEMIVPQLKAQITDFHTRNVSNRNLARISQAMIRYHEVNGRFPPATVSDSEGKPLYSWRVLLLPHLGGEAIYRRFHLNRAWDHPSNLPLLREMPSVYAVPGADKDATTTPYQVLAGPGGVFDDAEGRRMADILDGTSRTCLIVEAPPVPWSKPLDVNVKGERIPELGGVMPAGFHVAFADGLVQFIPKASATPDMLRGIFTRAGGENPIPP